MNIESFANTTSADEEKSTTSIWNRDISFSKKKLGDKEKSILYHQLKTLIGAGVDVKTALELVSEQLSKKKSTEIIKSVIKNLVKGNALNQAFETTGQFTQYEHVSLKIGEESSRLPQVLQTLSDYYEQKLEQRRQFVSALSYPILIVLSSIGAVAFMLLFIIPMFEEVFRRFGSELPALTLMIIGFSKALSSYAWLIFLFFVGLAVSFYLLSRNEKAVFLGEKVLMRIPHIGKLYLDIQLSRCAASMALLINASVPLTQTLNFVKQMMTMQHMRMALDQAQAEILKGRALHEALGDTPIFDKSFVSLVRVGEEVNKLGEFFEKLSVEYASAVSHRTKQLNTFLEPLMIVFLGLVVGLILVAMYLPMFQLSTSLEIN